MHNLIKLILTFAVLILLGYGGQKLLRERQLNALENKAIAEFERERYAEAINIYEEILELIGDADTGNARLSRVRRQVAQCYKNLAEQPGTPFYRSIEFYRKALSYDESSVEDETINRLLDAENLILPGQP